MDPFATEQDALAYATRNALRPTEFIATQRGSRINVVATRDTFHTVDGEKLPKFVEGRPYTLKVRVPEPERPKVVGFGPVTVVPAPRGPMADDLDPLATEHHNMRQDYYDAMGDE